MEIRQQTIGDVIVVAFGERFDAHNVNEARQALDLALQTSAQIVVDLGDVNFMDSAALAVLVQTMKNCRQGGGDLRVCRLQQPVQVIFELTRLDKALKIFSSRDDAVTSF